MSCPSEDEIVAFMEGRLTAPDKARLERHLDGCAACMALVTSVGKIYARSGEGSQEVISRYVPEQRVSVSDPPPVASASVIAERVLRTNTKVQLAAWSVHLAFAGLWWVGGGLRLPFGIILPEASQLLDEVGQLSAIAAYYVAWGASGLFWTLVNAVALMGKIRWARYSVIVYSLWSLPSVLGTLYGVYGLYTLTLRRALGLAPPRAHSSG